MFEQNIAFLIKFIILLGLGVTAFVFSCKYRHSEYEKMLKANKKKGETKL